METFSATLKAPIYLFYLNTGLPAMLNWCNKASKNAALVYNSKIIFFNEHQWSPVDIFIVTAQPFLPLDNGFRLKPYDPFLWWNHTVFALRDKTVLDLSLHSVYTCQMNMHYLGEPLKCCQKAFLRWYFRGWCLAWLVFHHMWWNCLWSLQSLLH